ncbi:hypothetical protein [Treponema sp.]|uniref:hypothetical protein n=1 Tax=Treponema sp. TaxID=166 RepID=UPI003F12BDE5
MTEEEALAVSGQGDSLQVSHEEKSLEKSDEPDSLTSVSEKNENPESENIPPENNSSQSEADEPALENSSAENISEEIPVEKSIKNLKWLRNGMAVGDAIPVYSGTKLTLYAETSGFLEGTPVKIKISEQDADENDEVEILFSQVRGNKIECAWTVIYMEDDDDFDSAHELEEKGFTMPEYIFTMECGGIKSEESKLLLLKEIGFVFGAVKNNTKDYIALKLEENDKETGSKIVLLAPNEKMTGNFDGAILKNGTIIKVSSKNPAPVNFTINENSEGAISYIITDDLSAAVDKVANIVKKIGNNMMKSAKVMSGKFENQNTEEAVLYSWWKTVLDEIGEPETWESCYNSEKQKILREAF